MPGRFGSATARPASRPVRWDRRSPLDGRAFVDAGDVAGFGFYDKFTLAAWIKPERPAGGTIVSRMVDQPEGDGYSVVLDRGKSRSTWSSAGSTTRSASRRRARSPPIAWTHVAVTYDGSRVAGGIEVYLDGELAPITVLLDELNQSFRDQGSRCGSAPAAVPRPVRRVRSTSRASTIVALGPEAIAILATSRVDHGDRRDSVPDAGRDGQASEAPPVFPGDRGPRASIRRLAAQARFRAGGPRPRSSSAFPTTMVMEEMPAPRPTLRPDPRAVRPARARGSSPACRCDRGLARRIERPDRLGLARWLVDPANPLTARVAVNRFWQMLFGTGLVKTVDDFGAQGEPPSHPELLDWLATEFVRSGWDVKAMLRLIVTSATYRQSSRVTPEALRHDPENRLLARGPRLRLPAEMIRDQALALGGLLVERTGGPSVKPYQPPGLWNELADADYVQDARPDLYRRSLYTFWKRTVPPPAMVAFDAPGRETCIVREVRTNTPLQALNVLNDVTYVEAARAFAERMMKEGGTTPEARVAAAFRAATARRPTARGARHPARRASRTSWPASAAIPRAAAALIHAGESRPNPRLDPCELAAYTAIAQLILNLDETITKE